MMTKSAKLSLKLLLPLALITLLSTLVPQLDTESAALCTHFVATSGSDSNNGTSLSTPFKTIQKGIYSISSGDVLCVRAGTYHEAITIANSGIASNPLTIKAYPGEKPIIDGLAGVNSLNSGLPSCPSGCSSSQLAAIDPRSGRGYVWEALVYISGDHILFDGFEIKRSMGRGVTIVGAQDVTVRNTNVHHSRHGGILVYVDAKDVTVESSRIWWNGEFATYSRASSPNWPMIVMVRGQNVLIRNNEVFNNWGEGVGAGRGSRYVTIEGNTIYDNYAIQIYVDHAQDVLINRNLTYFSDDPTFYRGGSPSDCIAINNEVGYSASLNKNIKVTNNLARGCGFNFGIWVQSGQWGSENVLVAHNTFVDGHEGGMRFAQANTLPHKNVRIKNNIIVQRSGIPLGLSSPNGITFSHNLWWPLGPKSGGIGSGDVYRDPMLAFSGSGAPFFGIRNTNSPAIGAALLDGDAVATDFYGKSRGTSSDIGAIEHAGSAPHPQPTTQPTTQPTALPTSKPAPIFGDVPADHPYHNEIELLYQAGYTSGCSTDPMMFCPEVAMNRADSAVFVQRGLRGANYLPPNPTTPLFDDLPPDNWAAKWAYGLYYYGYTAGCSAVPLKYCPWDKHTRTEGTVFYLRMLHGLAYTPPAAKGIFTDVPLNFWGAKWIEAAYSAGLIPACSQSPPLRFCPAESLSRAVAAYMMVQAKGLK